MTGATVVAPAPTAAPAGSAVVAGGRIYTCPGCAHELRMFGKGRHRVFFEATTTAMSDPVMNGACPACDDDLPARWGAARP